MKSAFPGFDSPAVGFEQPFEMLLACHERVRRSLSLLGRLVSRVGERGHDDATRSAASDVLRYFDLAAPLHHEDEETHVFPMLAASADAELVEAAAGLHADHLRMTALWSAIRPTLEAWSAAHASGTGEADFLDRAADFERIYLAHLATEEQLVFPAARERISASLLAAMSIDMARRRGAPAGPR